MNIDPSGATTSSVLNVPPSTGLFGLINNLNRTTDHIFKNEQNILMVVGKTFGHLSQSSFLDIVCNISEGPPPDVNLMNERNNGEGVLNLIHSNLVESVHDVSSGGLIMSLAEMSISSNIGINIEKPKPHVHLA